MTGLLGLAADLLVFLGGSFTGIAIAHRWLLRPRIVAVMPVPGAVLTVPCTTEHDAVLLLSQFTEAFQTRPGP